MRIESTPALRFLPPMRLLVTFFALACPLLAAVPAELEAALKTFRGDPPRGWSYTQTTSAEGKSTVERYDAARPEFDRWKLLQKDGRAPTETELREYADARSRRSRTGTAPKLIEQLDLPTLEKISDDAERATFRSKLRPGESRDHTAPFLRATLVLHKATQTIESVELGSVSEFAPTFGVRIASLRTLMTYSLPAVDRPTLPQKVETRVRGRAFLVKSLDGEMSVVYSDYRHVGPPAR